MQAVERTRPKGRNYSYDPTCFRNLMDYLNDGYKVIMCNRIGEELEYILEKEEVEE